MNTTPRTFVIITAMSSFISIASCARLAEQGDQDRQANNTRKLSVCSPWFSSRMIIVIATLERKGFHPRITETWRSPEEQEKYFLLGTSQIPFGFHNVETASGTPDSFAADVQDDRSASTIYIANLYTTSEVNGLITGIDWGLTVADRNKLEQALKSGTIDRLAPIGWDPYHVQPATIHLSDAIKIARRD